MSKFKLSLCAAALMMVGGHAVAADPVTQGYVTFNGKLIAETCSIVSGDEDKTVTLPTLSVLSLANAGDIGGTTDFTLSVEDCPATGINQVAANFEAVNSTGYDATTSNLTNSAPTATAAKNVQVRLFNASTGTQIPVGGTGAYFDVDTATGKATMHYVGGYYATAATEPGDVTAKVQYTLAYK